MAAEATPYPVLDLAERLLHKMQRVLLPRNVLAPPALARAPPKCGRRLERTPHGARPGWAAARFPDGVGEDLRDAWSPGHLS